MPKYSWIVNRFASESTALASQVYLGPISLHTIRALIATQRTNKDLDPVPRSSRKWGVTSFIAYWVSDAFNAATWQFAAGIISIGLSWREAIGIVALAFFIVSFVIALNGAIGVVHHAPFPVLARASWGFWGSYIAIVSRAILAIFWFAIQTMNGANTVRVMLGKLKILN